MLLNELLTWQMHLPEQEQCSAALKVENGHVKQLESNSFTALLTNW